MSKSQIQKGRKCKESSLNIPSLQLCISVFNPCMACFHWASALPQPAPSVETLKALLTRWTPKAGCTSWAMSLSSHRGQFQTSQLTLHLAARLHSCGHPGHQPLLQPLTRQGLESLEQWFGTDLAHGQRERHGKYLCR